MSRIRTRLGLGHFTLRILHLVQKVIWPASRTRAKKSFKSPCYRGPCPSCLTPNPEGQLESYSIPTYLSTYLIIISSPEQKRPTAPSCRTPNLEGQLDSYSIPTYFTPDHHFIAGAEGPLRPHPVKLLIQKYRWTAGQLQYPYLLHT